MQQHTERERERKREREQTCTARALHAQDHLNGFNNPKSFELSQALLVGTAW